MENSFFKSINRGKRNEEYIICLEKEEFNLEVLLSKSPFSKPGHEKLKKKIILSLGNWSIFMSVCWGKAPGF